jgi:hypothetical protein
MEWGNILPVLSHFFLHRRTKMPKPIDFSELTEKWPSPFITRRDVPALIANIHTAKYLANLDARGEGPPRFKLGGKVCYKVSDLIAWLEKRASI